MRPIKYKAWDKINKKWLNLYQIVLAANGQAYGVWDLAGELYGLHQVDLVEYTGLKDSEVTEEYLGDIIEENNGTRRVIEDGCSAVLFEDIKTGDIKYFWELLPHKVIGNIYQNPY